MGVLKSLSDASAWGETDPADTYTFTVRTPKLFHFDEENTNQIQEYLSNGIDLKEYALRHYSGPTAESFQPQCRQLGKALGRWLKGFVEWSAQEVDLRELIAGNTFAQDVKHMLNFLWLQDRIKDFPAILDDVGEVLGEVEQMAAAERQDTSRHMIIHGDFWTGK